MCKNVNYFQPISLLCSFVLIHNAFVESLACLFILSALTLCIHLYYYLILVKLSSEHANIRFTDYSISLAAI